MSRPANRPTKTVKWPNIKNDIVIYLNENDLVKSFVTDDRGRVRTYKRLEQPITGTLILGEMKDENNLIKIQAGTEVYEIEIYRSGDTSVIGYPNEKVTLIIHQFVITQFSDDFVSKFSVTINKIAESSDFDKTNCCVSYRSC